MLILLVASNFKSISQNLNESWKGNQSDTDYYPSESYTTWAAPLDHIVNASTHKDTSTPIPNEQLREAVRLIEIGKIDAKKVIVLDSTITLLRKQLTGKNNQLAAYLQREKTYELLITNYKKEIQLRSQSQDISTKWVTSLQKELRRSRTKTVLTGVLGLVATGITLYLTTK